MTRDDAPCSCNVAEAHDDECARPIGGDVEVDDRRAEDFDTVSERRRVENQRVAIINALVGVEVASVGAPLT